MILAIDFDGVIHDYKNPKPGRKMGPPIPGAKKALQTFMKRGDTVIIHSCQRSSVIADFMRFYEIPYSTIWVSYGKPLADVYLDDKAIRFEGWPLDF